jgi:hypothetical protein
MAGTRAASVAADCARCVPNAPLLVGVIHCEAKIALSNSLAVLGIFSLAYNRGKHGAFMHLPLSYLENQIQVGIRIPGTEKGHLEN